jgi:hypothetical protein
MFKITKYLQFRNTPDGKPRVLQFGDWTESNKFFDVIGESALHGVDSSGFLANVANLSDCRPLLCSKDKQELDIFNYFYPDNELKDKKWVDTNTYHLLSFDGKHWSFSDLKLLDDNIKQPNPWNLTQESVNIDYNPSLQEPRAKFEKIGNFADDPTKYSKLLWGCSEEEGWQKVFKLLEIEK